MPGKGHALFDRIKEVRRKKREAGPERDWRMLPIVTYERKKWFFDERLRQLRNIRNPHEWIDLNEFEMDYFIKRVKGKSPIRGFFLIFYYFSKVALLLGILVPYAATSRINSGIGYYSRNSREY
ncbi:MAG: hypothetical protein ABSB22_26075 [Thermodesulfobacteriota bacterium]